MSKFNLLDLTKIAQISVNPDNIIKGDMPGDKISISDDHIRKAQLILSKLSEKLVSALNTHPNKRIVMSICGGSGVGKSETASLLSHYLNFCGIGSYTLSGDNYPHRIPKYNDAERLRVFRESGIKGMVSAGIYDVSLHDTLAELQSKGNDSDPAYIKEYPWLEVYQKAGGSGLRGYLGTSNEIDFAELTDIISQFKNGSNAINLRRMGREETDLWYEKVDFTGKHVLIIEWTHGNSFHLKGVDVPILLNSTPEETLEHRRKRNRDGGTDSSFTTMVLAIEQDLLISQAINAKLILSKNGEFLSYGEFMRVMMEELKGDRNNE